MDVRGGREGMLRVAEGQAMGEIHDGNRASGRLMSGSTGQATARALASSMKLPSLGDFLMGAGLQHSTGNFKNNNVTVQSLVHKVISDMPALLATLKGDCGLNALQCRRCIAVLQGYVSEADMMRHRELVASIAITRCVRIVAIMKRTNDPYAKVVRELAFADTKAQLSAKAEASVEDGASPKKQRRRSSIVKNKKLFRPSVYDGRLEHEGYLEKRSTGVYVRWQRRFFSVRGNYLKVRAYLCCARAFCCCFLVQS